MERIGEEQKMTVKEVAVALGVAESTIRNKIKELYPEIIENGKQTFMTKQQAHELKKCIVPRDLTLKSKLENAVTSIDIEEMTVKVLQYHIAEAERLRIINAKQEEQLKIAEPKAKNWDDIASHEAFMNFRDAAGKMGLQQKDLMTLLRTKYIYKNTRGEYRAFSEYQHLFSLRPYTNGDFLGSQLMLTADGYLYFNKKVNG
jgi:hypothetical protein